MPPINTPTMVVLPLWANCLHQTPGHKTVIVSHMGFLFKKQAVSGGHSPGQDGWSRVGIRAWSSENCAGGSSRCLTLLSNDLSKQGETGASCGHEELCQLQSLACQTGQQETKPLFFILGVQQAFK